MKAVLMILLLVFCSFAASAQEKEGYDAIDENKVGKIDRSPQKSPSPFPEEKAETDEQDTATQKEPEKLQLIYAGVLEGDVIDGGERIRIVKKDNRQVNFIHGNTIMFCDSAFQFLERNTVEAYGNIKFIENDSLTITGDTLYYDGNTRIAKLRGNVVVQDENRTVNTKKLDYNLNTEVAYYYGGGRVHDDSLSVRSQRGYYNTNTKISTFSGDVVVLGDDLDMKSDSLTYNANNKIVYFNSETTIKTGDGVITANEGSTHNTVLGTSKLVAKPGEQSRMENEDYIISADFLDYDNITEKGVAEENVKVYSKKENLTVYGDRGYYNGLEDDMRMYGNGLLIRPMNEDTLYVSADTMLAFRDSTEDQVLLCYPKVRIYKSDMQAICDSLTYNTSDSMIIFDYDPVLWSGGSQMTAEYIDIKMLDNEIDRMFLRNKAFVVSEDTLRNYNQIKGNRMIAEFDSGAIRKVDVNGNGECVYYLTEESEEGLFLTGLNSIKCSNMILNFWGQNELYDILFVREVDGRVVPPHEFTDKNKFLKNFSWRADERPSMVSVTQARLEAAADPRALRGEEIIADKFQVFYDSTDLIFYKEKASATDIEAVFFLEIIPVNREDLPEDERKYGRSRIKFVIPSDALQGGKIFYTKELPDYPIRKIITGQKFGTDEQKWSSAYEFKQPKGEKPKTFKLGGEGE